jgi:RNA polymerase sigma-70 factor (ECF subfamily)
MSECHFDKINSLVALAQSGDVEAMSELHEFYQPLIKASIRKCLYIEASLNRFKDDLISIASIEFIKLVENYDINRSFFSYYVSNRLFPNLLKHSKDLLNKNSNNLSHEINFSDMPKLWDPEMDDPFGQIELRMVIQDALSELKPKHKEVIVMIFFDQLTQDEASELLNISQSALSKRLSRAIEELKKILEKTFLIME